MVSTSDFESGSNSSNLFTSTVCVAQLAERLFVKQEVAGSYPVMHTTAFSSTDRMEHYECFDIGSIPIVPSFKERMLCCHLRFLLAAYPYILHK